MNACRTPADAADAKAWYEYMRELFAEGDEDAGRVLPVAFALAIGEQLACWRCGSPAADFDAAIKPVCASHFS